MTSHLTTVRSRAERASLWKVIITLDPGRSVLHCLWRQLRERKRRYINIWATTSIFSSEIESRSIDDQLFNWLVKAIENLMRLMVFVLKRSSTPWNPLSHRYTWIRSQTLSGTQSPHSFNASLRLRWTGGHACLNSLDPHLQTSAHTHTHYKGFSYTHPHCLYPGGFNLTAMGLILQFPNTSHRG